MIALASRYAALPDHFYARLGPTPVTAPRLIRFNHPLAAELGLDVAQLDDAALAEVFAGNRVPPGAQPLAMAYAGHQFGHFVPQLGDGRALLLGEVRASDGRWREVQLKGSGRTPFSRGGDGRAALGPVLREYLVSEAMHALGIPATRALAAVLTGDAVYREEPLPGAVLTRVALSHVRVGTFQYFAARGDTDAVRRLVEFVIERSYPHLAGAQLPALALLRAVIDAQASLVARWMGVGFIHGVMNTDNMALSGETIDFGPCAFLDAYDPATVFSSIDHQGRYAYANQPHAASWNLTRLAETLLPLIDPAQERAIELATAALEEFPKVYSRCWLEGFRAKLGLRTAHPDDAALIEDLLADMQRAGADFTLTFRALSAASPPPLFDGWQARWDARLRLEDGTAAQRAERMQRVNPLFIPRNHRIEQVIRAAVGAADFAPFERLAAVLARPFEAQPGAEAYAEAPLPAERVLHTFCGT
jgi:uncharacterized protein YdiU (UPF0061 family)